jgi:arylsulfatase A-like enzyme
MEQQMKTKPNVIIIMADQLRFDAIGEVTPNINRLREESVVFERAYCASPLCVPARGAFFTGKYPNLTGSIINPWEAREKQHGTVRSGHNHLYELLEKEWDSWHTGKQHLFTDPKPEADPASRTHWRQLEGRYEAFLKEHKKKKPGGPDFQGIIPEMAFGRTTRPKRYSIPTTGRFAEELDYFFDGFILNDSLEAIRQRDRSKPFLLNAMFLAPHPPLDVPEPWYSQVKHASLPANVGRWSDNQSPLQLYNLTGAIGVRYTREDWEKIWPVYLGLVALLDHCVGLIIEELKREGLYDNTVIVFTSDHGEMLGSHSLWQKMCMYEESVRTPLYIKFPSDYQPAVKSSTALVSAIDVFPTICDFLGVSAPKDVSGVSLMPIVEGKSLDRERIFIQFDGNGARGNFQRCVVEGRYKLIVDLFKDETFIELYDVIDDPQEMSNLAFDDASQGALTRRLIGHLQDFMRATGDLLEMPGNVYEHFLEHYKPFKK